ncbi:hypothetical protein HK102_002437, partial [Quaeritorhiza haematococci]
MTPATDDSILVASRSSPQKEIKKIVVQKDGNDSEEEGEIIEDGEIADAHENRNGKGDGQHETAPDGAVEASVSNGHHQYSGRPRTIYHSPSRHSDGSESDTRSHRRPLDDADHDDDGRSSSGDDDEIGSSSSVAASPRAGSEADSHRGDSMDLEGSENRDGSAGARDSSSRSKSSKSKSSSSRHHRHSSSSHRRHRSRSKSRSRSRRSGSRSGKDKKEKKERKEKKRSSSSKRRRSSRSPSSSSSRRHRDRDDWGERHRERERGERDRDGGHHQEHRRRVSRPDVGPSGVPVPPEVGNPGMFRRDSMGPGGPVRRDSQSFAGGDDGMERDGERRNSRSNSRARHDGDWQRGREWEWERERERRAREEEENRRRSMVVYDLYDQPAPHNDQEQARRGWSMSSAPPRRDMEREMMYRERDRGGMEWDRNRGRGGENNFHAARGEQVPDERGIRDVNRENDRPVGIDAHPAARPIEQNASGNQAPVEEDDDTAVAFEDMDEEER